MEVFVARQPIFDRHQNVYGYELLYRSGNEAHYQADDGDNATLSVITNSMVVFGLGQLGNGRKVFINFTRNTLLGNMASYLPKKITVIEILEDILPDNDILLSLMTLKKNGYTLALDDFVLKDSEKHALVSLADIIKVDWMGTTPDERRLIIERFSRNSEPTFLAEKVETRQEFEEALSMGYSLFQGYFFSKPVLVSREAIPKQKLSYLQVLKELSKEHINFDGLQTVIKMDPSITLMLLRYINSAFFGLRFKVGSIKQALGLLGEKEVKRWMSLIVLLHMGKDQSEELIGSALLRARFCENLAPSLSMAAMKSELFLMGLFSYMDVLLGRPLNEVLDEVPLVDELKWALLGKDNRLRKVYELVLCYERGDWDSVIKLASHLTLEANDLPNMYEEAVKWTSETLLF